MKAIYLISLIYTSLACLNCEKNPQNTTDVREPKHDTNKTSTATYNITSLLLSNGSDSITLRKIATPCTTPNEDSGFCIAIKDCEKLLNQLDNKNAREFLNNSRCGPKNENSKNPKVCCGKYDNYKHLSVQENPFPKTCGHQKVQMHSKIFGGTKSGLGEYPWMARLIHKNSQKAKTFGCSGFLIAPKFVLTAAHCLKSENIAILGPISEVQLGEHNTETKIDCAKLICAPKPQVIRIKKNIIHPKYDINSKDHYHDIGLIHLKKPATFTEFVSPICLLEKIDFHIFEYWISGWGRTKTQSSSSIKMKVNLRPYPLSNCTIKYDQIAVQLNNKQICAGGVRNKDSCTGDSGGPLMVVKEGKHFFAAGIVSFGLSCGKEGWPGVYTNVTSYTDWIRSTMIKRITAKQKSKKTLSST